MELETKLIPKNSPIVLFLFYFLLFSYPLLSLLWRRSYPLLTVEVGTLFLMLAVVCVILTVILGKVRSSIVTVLTPLLITISFLIQFNFLAIGVTVCMSLGLVLAWRFREKFPLYGAPILLALIIGAYFDSVQDNGYLHDGNKSSATNAELPPIVHIILDSFIGVDGIPDYPASEIIKDELYSFFDEFQFRVFPKAYSRYENTGDSLYSAFNFRNDGKSEFFMEALGKREHVLKSNLLFDHMQQLGYRFDIYQTGIWISVNRMPKLLNVAGIIPNQTSIQYKRLKI